MRSKIVLAAGFYILGLMAYFVLFYEHILAAINYPDVLVVPIMTVGSFVAGSTFLGGGAVAFPALTKILQVDPFSAKTFSLAIQSVGMTSAAIYIISTVANIPYRLLVVYIIGAGGGLFFCLSYSQEFFTPTDIRISFTLFLICSLIIYFLRSYFITYGKKANCLAPENIRLVFTDFKQVSLVLLFGVAGGFISGLLGSGADLILFCLLSFYYKLSLKKSVQVSVVAMAAVSIMGICFQYSVNAVSDEVYRLWLLAAPVVLIGAPLGAIFCKKISAFKLLVLITLIAAVELVSTLLMLNIALNRLPIYSLVLAFSVGLLCFLDLVSPFQKEKSKLIDS